MSSKSNWIALIVSVVVAVVVMGTLTVFIGGSNSGDLLIGETASKVYPFTLQNVMHLLFFIGLGQLIVRWLETKDEIHFLNRSHFLPNENEPFNLKEINTRVTGPAKDDPDALLPNLIKICIDQYNKTKSVTDTISVLNSSLELNIHKLDLKYSMSRYVVWAIPTFGFIGTVIGIAQALGSLDIDKLTGAHKASHFQILTQNLSLAFNTTIVALGLSAILVFLLHVVQSGEEEGVNRAGNYVLRNLINRIGPDTDSK